MKYSLHTLTGLGFLLTPALSMPFAQILDNTNGNINDPSMPAGPGSGQQPPAAGPGSTTEGTKKQPDLVFAPVNHPESDTNSVYLLQPKQAHLLWLAQVSGGGTQPPSGQPPGGQPPGGQPPDAQPPSGQPPTAQPPNNQPQRRQNPPANNENMRPVDAALLLRTSASVVNLGATNLITGITCSGSKLTVVFQDAESKNKANEIWRKAIGFDGTQTFLDAYGEGCGKANELQFMKATFDKDGGATGTVGVEQPTTGVQDPQDPQNTQNLANTVDPQKPLATEGVQGPPQTPEDPQNPQNTQRLQNPENPQNTQGLQNPQNPQNPQNTQFPGAPQPPEDFSNPQNPNSPQDPNSPQPPQGVNPPQSPGSLQDPQDPQDPQQPQSPPGVPQGPQTPGNLQDPQVPPQDPQPPQNAPGTQAPQTPQAPQGPQNQQNPPVVQPPQPPGQPPQVPGQPPQNNPGDMQGNLQSPPTDPQVPQGGPQMQPGGATTQGEFSKRQVPEAPNNYNADNSLTFTFEEIPANKVVRDLRAAWGGDHKKVIIPGGGSSGTSSKKGKRQYAAAAAQDPDALFEGEWPTMGTLNPVGQRAAAAAAAAAASQALQRRGIFDPDWDKKFEVDTRLMGDATYWGDGKAIFSDTKTNLAVSCVGCGINGTISTSGAIDWSVTSGVKAGNVYISPSLKAQFALGLEKSKTSSKKTGELMQEFKKGFDLGLPGLNILGVITIGPYGEVEPFVRAGLKTTGRLLIGGSMEWKKASASYDIKKPGEIKKEGWTPEANPIFDLSAEISAEAAAGVRLSINCGIHLSFLGIDWKKGASVTDEVSIVAKAAVGGGAYIDDKTGEPKVDLNQPGQGKCPGINFSLGLQNRLYAELDIIVADKQFPIWQPAPLKILQDYCWKKEKGDEKDGEKDGDKNGQGEGKDDDQKDGQDDNYKDSEMAVGSNLRKLRYRR